MLGTHYMIFKVVGSLFFSQYMTVWVPHRCCFQQQGSQISYLTFHMSYITFQKEEWQITLLYKSQVRQEFSHKTGFLHVKNGSPQKGCHPSCLCADLLQKRKEKRKTIWRREWLLAEAMLADVPLQVYDSSPKFWLALYLALSLAIGHHRCNFQSKFTLKACNSAFMCSQNYNKYEFSR